MKIYKTTLYSCDCGYETTNYDNSLEHKKQLCGHKMCSEIINFMKETEHVEAMRDSNIKVTAINVVVNSTVKNLNQTSNTTKITPQTKTYPENML